MSARSRLVSCPARVHLPARSGLVNKVEFLKVVKTKEIVRSAIITLHFPYNSKKICSSRFEYLKQAVHVLNVARLHWSKSMH